MYVSQISGLNSLNSYSVPQKKVGNKRNVSFQSDYASTFKKGIFTTFRNIDPQVTKMCLNLIQQVKSVPGVALHPILDNKLYLQDGLPAVMRVLCKDNKTVLASDSYGKELITSSKGDKYMSLRFNDISSDIYILVEGKDDSCEVTITSTDGYLPTEVYKFYKYSESMLGNLKSYTEISGSGLGQTSTTTYYNVDGSVREGRTLLNRIFGL